MEQNVRVLRVRRISKDSKGNNINIVVVDLANGKPSIIRNSAQFVQDCKNSFLIPDTVNSINHPAVSRVLKGMKRGLISGDISYNKKGEMWTVTEDSRVLTDKNHPQYNKVAVGGQLPYQDDNTRVEGFLDIELNAETEDRLANAGALADAVVASRNVFDILDAPATEVQDVPEIAPSVLDDITGNAVLEEVADIVTEEETEQQNRAMYRERSVKALRSQYTTERIVPTVRDYQTENAMVIFNTLQTHRFQLN